MLTAAPGAGLVQCQSVGLAIERSRVRVPPGEFSSPRSIFCAVSYFGIRYSPVLPQKHVKDPCRSIKSAGGILQQQQKHMIMQFARNDTVNSCMAVRCTKKTREPIETAAVSGGTRHVTTNSALSTPLR